MKSWGPSTIKPHIVSTFVSVVAKAYAKPQWSAVKTIIKLIFYFPSDARM
jgi:hypothetical protein